jgi:hypothetical protein
MKFLLIYLLLIENCYPENEFMMYNKCLNDLKKSKSIHSTKTINANLKKCGILINKDRKHALLNKNTLLIEEAIFQEKKNLIKVDVLNNIRLKYYSECLVYGLHLININKLHYYTKRTEFLKIIEFCKAQTKEINYEYNKNE